MSVHPFISVRSKPRPPFDAYFTAEPSALPPVRLRPLTPLEQMYAYWGSDRE
jgi:hypothetical protein